MLSSLLRSGALLEEICFLISADKWPSFIPSPRLPAFDASRSGPERLHSTVGCCTFTRTAAQRQWRRGVTHSSPTPTARVFGFPLSVNTGSASGPRGWGRLRGEPPPAPPALTHQEVEAGDESSGRRYTVTDRQSKDATGRCVLCAGCAFMARYWPVSPPPLKDTNLQSHPHIALSTSPTVSSLQISVNNSTTATFVAPRPGERGCIQLLVFSRTSSVALLLF